MLYHRVVLPVLAVVTATLGTVIWASGKVSWQDERTVYTAVCEGARWDGSRCAGRLVPADRYRFHVVKERNEVSFWLVGAGDRGHQALRHCRVLDALNWSCPAPPGLSEPVATEMHAGQPVLGGGRAADGLRAISKWRWYSLRWGIASDKGSAVANLSVRHRRGPDLRDARSVA